MGRASTSLWPRQWRKSSPPCKRRISSPDGKPVLTSRLLTSSWDAAEASDLVPVMNWRPALETNEKRASKFLRRMGRCTLPLRKGAASRLLLQLRFVRSCWENGCFGFEFSKLFRADKAHAAAGHVRSQNPGDIFHLSLARQSPVFVERALTHRKMNLAFEIEVSAINFFLGGAESLDDVPVAACTAQRVGALRSSPFHFDRDHDFLFSKKRSSASGCAPCAGALQARTPRTMTRTNHKTRATMRHTSGRSMSVSFKNC